MENQEVHVRALLINFEIKFVKDSFDISSLLKHVTRRLEPYLGLTARIVAFRIQ